MPLKTMKAGTNVTVIDDITIDMNFIVKGGPLGGDGDYYN